MYGPCRELPLIVLATLVAVYPAEGVKKTIIEMPGATVEGTPPKSNSDQSVEPRPRKEIELRSGDGQRASGSSAAGLPGVAPAVPSPPPPPEKLKPSEMEEVRNEKKALDAEFNSLMARTYGTAAEMNAASAGMITLLLRKSLLPEFNTRGVPIEIPLETRVQRVLKTITDLRDQGKGGVVLRNAERYAHGLYGSLASDKAHILLSKNAELYDELKRAALSLKKAGFPQAERLMRTDPTVQISEPGGHEWLRAGLEDGDILKQQLEIYGERGGFLQTLPRLQDLGPEVILIQPTPYVETTIDSKPKSKNPRHPSQPLMIP